MPSDARRQLQAARTNVTLVKYVIFLCFAAIFLAAACFFVYFFLQNSKTAAEEVLKNSNSQDTSYASVQSQANSLRTTLSSAKSILDQEILYSETITGIASALPEGVVLDTLTLNSTTFGAPVKLQLRARTTEAALRLEKNFQASPLFSGFNMESLSTSSQSSEYPVTVGINIMINRGVGR